MENAPIKPEDDGAENKSSSKKKKKSVEALGVFAVEPESSKKSENAWEKLTLTTRRAGRTESVTPLTEALQAEELKRSPEVDEEHLDKLTPDEEQFVITQLIEPGSVAETAPTETEQVGAQEASTEGAAIDAAEAVEAFRRDLLEGKSREEAFQDALTRVETAGTLPPPAPEKPTSTTGVASPDKGAETSIVPEPDIPDAETSRDHSLADKAGSTPHVSVPAPEAADVSAHHADTDPQPPMAQVSSLVAGGVSGGSNPPPVTGGRFPVSGGGNVYAAPPSAAPNTAQAEKTYKAGDVMSAALLGGLIGYLIGRRRGRIKTERKLKPIQKKLEKQVKGLHEDIRWKEFYIRKAANERTRDRQRIFHMERMQEKTGKKPEEPRQIAPEANQLHGKKVAPERIGQVLVAADRETSRQQPEASRQKAVVTREVNKRVATMSRSELLDLSEKVAVENTTLRQVYETQLVSEQGLRRLIGEYVSGGDVQRALRQELVEHEIDFERDPMLRDKLRATAADSGPGGSQTLQQLLHKANVLDGIDTDGGLTVLKAEKTRHADQPQQKYRRLLDVSMAAAIAVLFVLVLTLLLSGR